MKRIWFVLLALFLCQAVPAQQQTSNPNLASLKFLLGKWIGEGSAEAGTGSGYFTFETSLQDKALVRKNHSEYRAAKEGLLYVHDDLMIVYLDAATKQVRAFYTDSEGHVINYATSISRDGKRFVFLSDAQADGPRYRLTYTVTQPNAMSVTLEMAPADRPDQFEKTVEGKVRRSS
jgi:hypothetical protein